MLSSYPVHAIHRWIYLRGMFSEEELSRCEKESTTF